ncbi:MAG: hypothetical protein Q9191_001659 [Dirinaria sp. TL-2023a]
MTGRLNRVLNLAMTALAPALEDVKLGTASTHGFRALFKYDGAKEYVEDMLKQVSKFEPMLQLLPNPNIPLRPRIACAQPGIRERHRWLPFGTDPWVYCSFGSMSAFFTIGTAYVFICPSFFMLPEKPTDLTGRNCPTVRDNRYNGNDRTVSSYQTYALIHELMHFYLQSHSLTGVTHPNEQYGLNGCAPDPDKSPFDPVESGILQMPAANTTFLLAHNLSLITDTFPSDINSTTLNPSSIATA